MSLSTNDFVLQVLIIPAGQRNAEDAEESKRSNVYCRTHSVNFLTVNAVFINIQYIFLLYVATLRAHVAVSRRWIISLAAAVISHQSTAVHQSLTSPLCQSSCGRWYRYRFDRRAFAVAGPTVWNSLPANLQNPTISTDNFIHITEEWRRGCLEDRPTSVLSGLYRCRHDDALHKSIFTYLLTFNVTTRHCSVVFW